MTHTKLQIREKIQKEIDHYGQYIVTPENNYCFCISSPVNNSITSTLIDNIKTLGYGFLHVQNKTIADKTLIVARFTYERNDVKKEKVQEE